MTWKAILLLGPAFIRGLRKIPNLLYRTPKSYQFLQSSVRSGVVSKGYGFSRLFGYLGNAESLVGFVRRTVSATSAPRGPRSLLRAYVGLAGSVHWRNQIILLPSHSYTTMNKLSEPQKRPWMQSLLGSVNRVPRLPSISDQPLPLSPKEILGFGCNSAVWAADLKDFNGGNSELAVKVLYNYYTSSSENDVTLGKTESRDVNPIDWILLRRQLERECKLRPSSGHPNIVPIIGQFFGRSPASAASEHLDGVTDSTTMDEVKRTSRLQSGATSQKWIGCEAFPDGFGENSYTYYLLMPRFDATLGDLLKGRWCPSNAPFIGPAIPQVDISSVGATENSSTSRSLSSASGNLRPCIPLEDAVSICAQLFDAVAELESCGIAHRDIKPDNILIRQRNVLSATSSSGMSDQRESSTAFKWLDDREVSSTNTSFHVALTDFGCAFRTKPPEATRMVSRLSQLLGRLVATATPDTSIAHSGNVALLAPEVARALQDGSRPDYSKADLWAMATIIYPLFGMNNPFIDSDLNSLDYSESDLPSLPDSTPGVVRWLLAQCLQRSPESRPAANLVADVLHTWHILRNAHRRHAQACSQGTARMLDELSSLELLDQLSSTSIDKLNSTTVARLRTLLDVSWASDWLTGAARPPDGIRVSFYRRVTLNRFAHCLRIVYHAESARAVPLASEIATSLGPTS